MSLPRLSWTCVRKHGFELYRAWITDASGRTVFETQQNSEAYARTVAERWWIKHKGEY